MGVIGDKLSQIRFDEFIMQLNQGGWFQYVFPFMLVYAVVLTILNQVSVFEERKSVKVIVAMIFGLFAIAFPISDNSSCGLATNTWAQSSDGCTLGDMMMTLFPGVTAFTLGILALYIVAAMMGVDLMKFFGSSDRDNNWIKYILGILGILVVAYYYARGFGWDGFGSGSVIEEFFKDPVLYIIILFGLFFWYITNEDTSSESMDAAATRARKAAHEIESHRSIK